ncbi:uncharacterized protein [Dysidea avara]|uniref:uncharacterized protein n=1 Tax=Dysidea avara TaxID=196820 RepID=UPI00331C76BF
MDRVVVTLMFYLLTIAGIVECQRCSGRVITAAKDECTLAINNMRRVGSSSIACKPGECREQLRAGFASGACTYNYYTVELVNEICSGKYDCKSVTVSTPMFITGDVSFDSFCRDVSDELSREGCRSSVNSLRTSGSQNNKACTGRCPELLNATLGECGYDTVNTYTAEEIVDYCSGRFDDPCSGSSNIKGLPSLIFLLALLIIIFY